MVPRLAARAWRARRAVRRGDSSRPFLTAWQSPREAAGAAKSVAISPWRRGFGHGLLVFLAFVAVLALSAALPRPVQADDPLAEKELEVERQLGCPICTNLPLNVCDNQLCQEMRGVIRQKLAAGETPDQVVTYFVSRYGEAVLLEPPPRGFSLAAWDIPILAIVVGAVICLTFLRRSLHRQKLTTQHLLVEEPTLDRYREQVRRDLEKLEESG